MHERCAVCGLRYLEDQGDLFGYLFVLDRILFVVPLIGMVFLRLWVPNAWWFYAVWAAAMVALVYTLPHRTGISIAIDYYYVDDAPAHCCSRLLKKGHLRRCSVVRLCGIAPLCLRALSLAPRI